jgi:hypothetical protein
MTAIFAKKRDLVTGIGCGDVIRCAGYQRVANLPVNLKGVDPSWLELLPIVLDFGLGAFKIPG